MSERQLYRRLVVMGIVVGAILVADGSGLLSTRASVILDDASQLTAGLLATAACAWSARRTAGYERTWRWLMAVGFGAWSVGQAIWSYYQVVLDVQFPSPSLADVGYLAMPVFAFAALLAITFEDGRRRTPILASRGLIFPSWILLVLDGLIITGSLVLLTASTTLGVVIRAGASSVLGFAVAVAYPITDVLLVVIVFLMVSMQPVAQRLRPQLLLLGLGLVGLAVSDSIFTYLFTIGAESTPPVANAGFIAGPLLIGLAAITTGEFRRRQVRHTERRALWTQLLLPYIPLTITGCLLTYQEVFAHEDQAFEIILGIPVVALVVVRQMMTLVENTALLERISEAQEKLRFQAYHDPVTGLANRTLFRLRLESAVEADHHAGRPIALFFLDLDDFKEVNDRFGHASGDIVLEAVADRLRSCVRAGDLVARLGGDEFGVLAEGDVTDPAELGRRIQDAMRAPFAVNNEAATVAASMGAVVTDGTETGLTSDVLLRRADDAMYEGKRQGKGLLVFYHEDSNS